MPSGEEQAFVTEALCSEGQQYTSMSDAGSQNQPGSPYQDPLSPYMRTEGVLIEKDSSTLLGTSGTVDDPRWGSHSASISLPADELKASAGAASEKEDNKKALTVIDSSRDKLVKIQRQQDHESMSKASKERSKLNSAQRLKLDEELLAAVTGHNSAANEKMPAWRKISSWCNMHNVRLLLHSSVWRSPRRNFACEQ
jgi:hypothetical protein